jgi:hypothetical protein
MLLVRQLLLTYPEMHGHGIIGRLVEHGPLTFNIYPFIFYYAV